MEPRLTRECMEADGNSRSFKRRVVFAVTSIAIVLSVASPRPAAADVRPFDKLDCMPREDVRFCEGLLGTRVRSFDGVPLDTNVALPATGDTRLPLVVL